MKVAQDESKMKIKKRETHLGYKTVINGSNLVGR